MIDNVHAFPLCWPQGFPRYRHGRTRGAFRTDFEAAIRNVRNSLDGFARDSGKKIETPTLSSNVDFNPLTDGRNKRPADPGVAVWFTWDGMTVCIPVDRYDTPAANLQAIHHIIEARRTELRHGTLALVRSTFTGFQALPAPKGKHWRDVLKISGHVSAAAVDENYKRLAKSAHPDAGGSTERMAELNAARDHALKEIGGSP